MNTNYNVIDNLCELGFKIQLNFICYIQKTVIRP